MSGKLTPMMEQYQAIKQSYPDCLLFFRLGDFYEMFFDDAKTVSRELELTLTARSSGGGEKAPMCGVPYHSVEGYIQRLVQRGYKVAICDQVEDPALAKGIVKREITRIVTPGTTMAAELTKEQNNYIMSLTRSEDAIGLATCDMTTGEFLVTEFEDESKLFDEIAKFQPSQLLVNQEILDLGGVQTKELEDRFSLFIEGYGAMHYRLERARETLLRHFHVLHLEGLGLSEMELGVSAAGSLLDYLSETQKRELSHISQVKTYSVQSYMMLDSATRRNLELTKTLRDKDYKGSLLWVLDRTQTAMGGRLLRRYLEQPLIDPKEIQNRLDMVEDLVKDPMLSQEMKELLSGIYDMERLMGRISYGSANARDLLSLKDSLFALPALKLLLSDLHAPGFAALQESLDSLEDIASLLEASIHEEAPLTLREGGIIKKGYSPEVDHLRLAATEGKDWIAKLEAREKEATGIKNLRVGYNHVFGYYLEVSKGNLSLVPDRFIRKQTLVNGERFITPELKEIEDELLGAKEKAEALEYQLFSEIRQKVFEAMSRIQKSAGAVACIDALRSLAETAYRHHYVKPDIQPMGGAIIIKDGRHPVVEQMIGEEAFIANSTELDLCERRIMIITGPNMAGKSTYMRQVAAIVLMAQIGSFVPASEASISVVDRIFTRVGASDDLAGGQSTFMVEMSEVSNILRHATKNSLLILDEIGRGTSTFDGLSIAWAVVEHIADPHLIGAKALFATHYHELTQLEGELPGVKNYCVSIKESGDTVIFLHKIQPGSGDRSYGIEVAKLAGLPRSVTTRARELLEEMIRRADGELPSGLLGKDQMELGSFAEEKPSGSESLTKAQEEVLSALSRLSVYELTPLEAMQYLDDWKKKLDSEE